MRAALYIRVSSADQVKGYSLEAQEDLLRRYAKDHNMTVYKLYADEGISANKALSKRQALLEMVADAEAGLFGVILFKDITRWSRNSYQYYIVNDRLEKAGVSWVAVEQPYLETRTPTGRFQVGIMLGTAQLESENNSQRVRFVLDAMIRSGIYPLAKVPLGYITNESRHLVKDPKTEPMMNDLFKTLLETRNGSATRRYIQDKYGRAFTSTYFSRVAHNEIYTGKFRDVENFCEPYITETDRSVILKTRSPFSVRSHTDLYTFRGLVKCARCGTTLAASLIRGHVYYRCYHNYMHRTCDQNVSLRQDRLEQMMLTQIRPAFDAYKYRVEIEQSKTDNSERIESIRGKLKRLNELYIDGAIERDVFDAKRADYKARIEQLTPQRINDTDEVQKLLNSPWETLYNDLDEKGRGAFWRSIVRCVRWDGKDIEIDFL
jgi:DNA invertase Pin-like site-specific DNA recombinase